MKGCSDLRVNKEYTYGTPAFVWKCSCSITEDRGDSNTISRACFAYLLAFLVGQEIRDGYRLADCVVCRRTELLANFVSGKVRSLSRCRFQTASVVKHFLTRGVCTAITCLNTDIYFASRILL